MHFRQHTLWALIRLLPSANWSGSILSHSEWWYMYKRQRLNTNTDMKQTADDNHYIPVWKLLTRRKATAQSLYYPLGATAGWPSGVRTILLAQQGHGAVVLRAPYDYRKSLRSFLGQNDNLKSYVVLTITVRYPYGDRTTSLRCVYGLRAYDFFKFVIVRS